MNNPAVRFGDARDVEWQGKWIDEAGQIYFRLNVEGYQGVFKLTRLAKE